MTVNQPDKQVEEPWPDPKYSWYVVGVLFVALTFSFIDRQIVNLLVGPIKRDLGISDVQMSLLMGFAFAAFYTIMGLPISRLSDTKSRRVIIGVGAAVWSAMTAACGLAQNYLQLFASRVGVGAGEAALQPAAYSILSDYFPPEKLPRAFGVYYVATSVGGGLALIIGGAVIQMLDGMDNIAVPFVGTIYPWQMAFIAAGLPGFIVSALIFTVREPVRRGSMNRSRATGAVKAVPIGDVLRFILSRWTTYAPIYFGISIKLMMGYGILVWIPAYLQRSFGWSFAEVGAIYGAMTIVFGGAGSITGGMIASWFLSKGYSDGTMRTATIGTVIAIPFSVLFPLMPTPTMALVLMAPFSFFSAFGMILAPAALQSVTPNEMRAQVSAGYLFMVNLIGAGLGPTVVALFTDYVYRSEQLVTYSMATVGGIFGPIAAVILWSGLAPYRRSFEAMNGPLPDSRVAAPAPAQ